MNTSELYFNTPVIDEAGYVKQLSDFGGGGGFTIRKLEPNIDYIVGNAITDGTLNIYEIAENVCVAFFDGVKFNLQSGANTVITFIGKNIVYTNSGCVVGSTVTGSMTKNQYYSYVKNDNILNIVNSYSGIGTAFFTGEKLILLS